MHQTIIIATSNKGKVKEFESIAQSLKPKAQSSSLILKTIDEIYTGIFDPEETGLTFQENALIKAQAAAKILGSDRDRRRDHSPLPLTPPYIRVRIRRFG